MQLNNNHKIRNIIKPIDFTEFYYANNSYKENSLKGDYYFPFSWERRGTKSGLKFHLRNEEYVTDYLMSVSFDNPSLLRMPKNWNLYGSNDNLKWNLIDERIEQIDWIKNEIRRYKIKDPGFYKFYKILILEANNENSLIRIKNFALVSNYSF